MYSETIILVLSFLLWGEEEIMDSTIYSVNDEVGWREEQEIFW